jgi:hypothetical protein
LLLALLPTVAHTIYQTPVSTDFRVACAEGQYVRAWVMIIAPYSKSSGQNIDGLSNSTTTDGQSSGDMVLPPLGHSEVADVLEINANLSQEIISYVSLAFLHARPSRRRFKYR